jgi:hypothetical protein
LKPRCPTTSEWFDVADRARKDWKAREIPMHKRRPSLLAAINDLYEGLTV